MFYGRFALRNRVLERFNISGKISGFDDRSPKIMTCKIAAHTQHVGCQWNRLIKPVNFFLFF